MRRERKVKIFNFCLKINFVGCVLRKGVVMLIAIQAFWFMENIYFTALIKLANYYPIFKLSGVFKWLKCAKL